MIKLSKCHVGDEELQSIQQVLAAAYLGMGKQVFDFEAEIKAYLGTEKEVICVNSGTAALHLALACLDIGLGDEVIIPTLTFAACFQAVTAVGAKPIACDVREDTLSIDLASANKLLSPKTKAIMPVHYASHVESIETIYDFANAHQLRVIEDAAHAFGSYYKQSLVGCQGDVVCFSFDGIKNITCGEGGAILTSDTKLIERLRDARLLAVEKDYLKRKAGQRSWEFDIVHQGFRYHMSDIMAAIGRSQLRKIEEFRKKRKEIVACYLSELANLPELSFLSLNYEDIMPHIFVVRIANNKRDALRAYLNQHDIEVGIHYKPNHLLSRHKTIYRLETAEKAYEQILTLPLHVGLTQDEQNKVIAKVKEFFHA